LPANEEKTIESVPGDLNNQKKYPFDTNNSEDISHVQFKFR
jgi:hypothetical protein